MSKPLQPPRLKRLRPILCKLRATEASNKLWWNGRNLRICRSRLQLNMPDGRIES